MPFAEADHDPIVDNAPSIEESEVRAGAPITMANWIWHPSIKAIRTEIWQVVRDVGGVDHEPRAEEKYQPSAAHTNPAEWFQTTGCGH